MDFDHNGKMDCRPTAVLLGGAITTSLISYLLDKTMESAASGNVDEELLLDL